MASTGSSEPPLKKAKSSLAPKPYSYLSASAFCGQSCNLVPESTVDVNPAALVALRWIIEKAAPRAWWENSAKKIKSIFFQYFLAFIVLGF
jgi:hypothetical protein